LKLKIILRRNVWAHDVAQNDFALFPKKKKRMTSDDKALSLD
jgi:hypothetical protein